MLVASALAGCLLAASPGDYAAVVHAELGKAAKTLEAHRSLIIAAARAKRVSVLELEIDPDGIAAMIRTSRSTGDAKLDDVLRSWVLAVDPFPTPPEEVLERRLGATCVLRVHGLAGGSRLVSYAVACLPPSSQPQVVGWTAEDETAYPDEPGALVFAGWVRESVGDYMRARLYLRRAAEIAPDWPLAAGAFGLSLVRSGKVDQGRPFLEKYALARGVPDEIREQLGALATAGPTRAGPEKSFSQCMRSPEAIQVFVQESGARIDNCLRAELDRAPGAPMPPYLPIKFIVRPSGDIGQVEVDHRSFRESKLRDCIEIALAGEMDPAEGSNCPGQFTLRVVTESDTPDR